MCGQHASSNAAGAYHSHIAPPCLLNQLGAKATTISPMIGYMYDGFPIYGPRGPDGVYMKRCSETSANSTFCLDQCGGYYDASQKYWADGFTYRYFALGPYNGVTDQCSTDMWRAKTVGAYTSCGYEFPSSFYPFMPLCLRGCAPTGVTMSSSDNTITLPTCSSKSSYSVINGYTSASAIPAATAQLAVYSTVASCISTACTSAGYPNVGACVHDTSTGAYSGSTTSAPVTSPTATPNPPTRSPTFSPTYAAGTPTPKPSTTTDSSDENDNSLSTAIIAVIVVTGCVAIAGIVAAVFFLSSRKQVRGPGLEAETEVASPVAASL